MVKCMRGVSYQKSHNYNDINPQALLGDFFYAYTFGIFGGVQYNMDETNCILWKMIRLKCLRKLVNCQINSIQFI